MSNVAYDALSCWCHVMLVLHSCWQNCRQEAHWRHNWRNCCRFTVACQLQLDCKTDQDDPQLQVSLRHCSVIDSSFFTHMDGKWMLILNLWRCVCRVLWMFYMCVLRVFLCMCVHVGLFDSLCIHCILCYFCSVWIKNDMILIVTMYR